FFPLQDRLGFDKASKTLNWLLAQSKLTIDRLVDAADQAAVVTGGRPTLMKGRGEGSNSSTCCLTDSRQGDDPVGVRALLVRNMMQIRVSLHST
ncbi:hypothetical protein ACJX0J_042176, partial [Zea mays]